MLNCNAFILQQFIRTILMNGSRVQNANLLYILGYTSVNIFLSPRENCYYKLTLSCESKTLCERRTWPACNSRQLGRETRDSARALSLRALITRLFTRVHEPRRTRLIISQYRRKGLREQAMNYRVEHPVFSARAAVRVRAERRVCDRVRFAIRDCHARL